MKPTRRVLALVTVTGLSGLLYRRVRAVAA